MCILISGICSCSYLGRGSLPTVIKLWVWDEVILDYLTSVLMRDRREDTDTQTWGRPGGAIPLLPCKIYLSWLLTFYLLMYNPQEGRDFFISVLFTTVSQSLEQCLVSVPYLCSINACSLGKQTDESMNEWQVSEHCTCVNSRKMNPLIKRGS